MGGLRRLPCRGGTAMLPLAAMRVQAAPRDGMGAGPGGPPASTRGGVLAGVLLMLGAGACFAALDASGKWLNQAANPVGTAAVRYVASFLLVSLFINPWTPAGLPRSARPGLQVVRAGFLVAATLCSFTAYRSLPLTQATAITFAAPLIVAVLAGPLLGEWVGRRGAAAVLAGFGGVLVITRPFGAGFEPAMLLGLGTGVANAGYIVATRFLAGRDTSRTTLFYTGLVGTVAAVPALPFTWAPPGSLLGWAVTGALGVFGAAGHWLMILAHRRAPASLLAPFSYGQLLWAAALGGLVFGEGPDRWTLLGGGVVIAAGLYLLWAGRR